MTPERSADITALLGAWGGGDPDALSRLMTALYPELRRIARRHLGQRRPGHTLESAAVANEAYLKLLRAGGLECDNRVHFLALCSQMIRRLLVDHARKHAYAKRGGDAVRVTLCDERLGGQGCEREELLAIDEALEHLAKIDLRKSRLVELRYFGGLSVEEAAQALGVSPETAKRDWRMAKAWMYSALRGGALT